MDSAPLVFARAAAEAKSPDHQISAIQADGGALILAVLGKRTLVFSEARQAIFELDEVTATAVRWLDPDDTDRILREVVNAGTESLQAGDSRTEAQVGAPPALEHAPAPSLKSSRIKSTNGLTRLSILIADVAVELHVSKTLVADVQSVFGRLITDAHDSHAQLCARLDGATVKFSSPGLPEWSCDRSQFIPLLKAQLVEFVIQCARYEVALHAAALGQDDDALLLVGSPGAGKTTLAIALAMAGLDVISDDVALLNEQGRVTGLSLPFAAKSSSWSLLQKHWPGMVTGPSHWRPDGKELCYIDHAPLADPLPRRIGSVILLNRQDQSRASIEELDPVSALTALIAEGATRDERLSSNGFTALVEGLREARCFRLTYSDLIEAAEVVRGLGSP